MKESFDSWLTNRDLEALFVDKKLQYMHLKKFNSRGLP